MVFINVYCNGYPFSFTIHISSSIINHSTFNNHILCVFFIFMSIFRCICIGSNSKHLIIKWCMYKQICFVSINTYTAIPTLLFSVSSHCAVFRIRSAPITKWLISNNHSNSTDPCKLTSCQGNTEPQPEWKYCQTVIGKQTNMLWKDVEIKISLSCTLHVSSDLKESLLDLL